MDILLAFPPLGNHEHPHLGLPFLRAYLAEHGYSSCRIKDYNVVIMSRIIDDLMNNRGEIFNASGKNIYEKYTLAKNIMKGNSLSDKLKSAWAMELIADYLRKAGLYIYNNISFDPVDFHAIENEFKNTSLNGQNNVVLNYIKDEVVPDILKNRPVMIGFSIVFASQIYYTFLICKEIRKHMPDMKIALGGPQVSIFWRAFINSTTFAPFFDVINREQGEAAILALADCWIKNKGSLNDVPNIVYRDKENRIKTNTISDHRDMNNIPVPDFRDVPLELYAYAKLPYQMTRGCYWGRCAFCGYRGCDDKYIFSDKEKVVNDLKTLKERHGIRIFHLMDDSILPRHLVNVAEQITRESLDIIYAAYLRAEKQFDEASCRTLYTSGLRAILFGFESSNTRIRELIDKGITLDTTVKVLKDFKKAGVANYLACIIGFPTEQKHEAYETIDFLVNNKDIYFRPYLSPFRLFSHMVEEPDKYCIEDIDIYNPMRHDKNGYVSLEYTYRVKKGMSIKESIDALYEGRKLTNSSPPGPIYFR